MKNENKNKYLKITIWFNLLIGFYNLYTFNQINSFFHLILGSANIGVWVFCKEKLELIPLEIKNKMLNEKDYHS